MSIILSQCINCSHLIVSIDAITEDGRRKCHAFPDGIPEDIFDGEFFHENEYLGDHGFRYDPVVKSLDNIIRESFKF